MEKLIVIGPQDGDGSKSLKIRPHHLFCIQGFQGYGYSKEFKINLANIIEKIRKHPQITIEIVTGADCICKSCPYNFRGICKVETGANNRILSMDKLIMKKLDLYYGSVYHAYDVLSKTGDLNLEDFTEICGSCSWKTKCSWFQSLE